MKVGGYALEFQKSVRKILKGGKIVNSQNSPFNALTGTRIHHPRICRCNRSVPVTKTSCFNSQNALKIKYF
jgi:hypothetical protein